MNKLAVFQTSFLFLACPPRRQKMLVPKPVLTSLSFWYKAYTSCTFLSLLHGITLSCPRKSKSRHSLGIAASPSSPPTSSSLSRSGDGRSLTSLRGREHHVSSYPRRTGIRRLGGQRHPHCSVFPGFARPRRQFRSGRLCEGLSATRLRPLREASEAGRPLRLADGALRLFQRRHVCNERQERLGRRSQETRHVHGDVPSGLPVLAGETCQDN